MNKFIIIVILVILIVVVCGLFAWPSISKWLDIGSGNDVISLSKGEDIKSEKSIDSVLKEAVILLAIKSGSDFSSSTKDFGKQIPENFFLYTEELKKKTGISIDYIALTDIRGRSFVAKTMLMGSDKFYCLDSLDEPLEPVIVPIDGGNFKSMAAKDCNYSSVK
jgi:uncharacterized protein YxeA